MPAGTSTRPQPSTTTSNTAAQAQEEDIDIDTLKAPLWLSIGRLVDAESARRDINASPRFIGALTEMVWSQIELIGPDVEAFARHAGRSTINAGDVMLLARRNEGLADVLKGELETFRARGN